MIDYLLIIVFVKDYILLLIEFRMYKFKDIKFFLFRWEVLRMRLVKLIDIFELEEMRIKIKNWLLVI